MTSTSVYYNPYVWADSEIRGQNSTFLKIRKRYQNFRRKSPGTSLTCLESIYSIILMQQGSRGESNKSHVTWASPAFCPLVAENSATQVISRSKIVSPAPAYIPLRSTSVMTLCTNQLQCIYVFVYVICLPVQFNKWSLS